MRDAWGKHMPMNGNAWMKVRKKHAKSDRAQVAAMHGVLHERLYLLHVELMHALSALSPARRMQHIMAWARAQQQHQ